MQLRLVDGLPERESVRRATGQPKGSSGGRVNSVKSAKPAGAKTRRAPCGQGRPRDRPLGRLAPRRPHQRIGRAGVATARAALERADRPDPGTPLSEAS